MTIENMIKVIQVVKEIEVAMEDCHGYVCEEAKEGLFAIEYIAGCAIYKDNYETSDYEPTDIIELINKIRRETV